MRRSVSIPLVVLALALIVAGCYGLYGKQTRHASSVVQYLYPDQENVAVTPSIPVLSLPIKAGIAFVPDTERAGDAYRLSEKQKLDIMDQIAAEFAKYPFVKSIERIPTVYLRPKGGFTNLDQIRTMHGIDVIALISYDQVQHTNEDLLSIAYWTIVGMYVVKGEKNDTSTMMDTAVYHIASRKLLFRAPGTSQIKGSATPVNLAEQLRKDSYDGFVKANEDMIANLHTELERFKEKVKTKPEDYKVVQEAGYKGGGGFDPLTAILILMTGGAALWLGRKRS
jgi:rhombotail lipoprotein